MGIKGLTTYIDGCSVSWTEFVWPPPGTNGRGRHPAVKLVIDGGALQYHLFMSHDFPLTADYSGNPGDMYQVSGYSSFYCQGSQPKSLTHLHLSFSLS